MTDHAPQDPAPAPKLPLPVAYARVGDISVRRFDLGLVDITANALATIPLAEVGAALHRHASGDWSELGEIERECNEQALAEGGLIASFYTSQAGKRFWILTEADRSATTVMMPFDY